MSRDTGLDVLLELSGTEYTEDNGYWYRIEAWRVTPDAQIPHGIRYNLTLHDHHNQRIFGMDNAHAPHQARGSYRGRLVEYDHVHSHMNDKGTPYAFRSAQQLLHDFFDAVDARIFPN